MGNDARLNEAACKAVIDAQKGGWTFLNSMCILYRVVRSERCGHVSCARRHMPSNAILDTLNRLRRAFYAYENDGTFPLRQMNWLWYILDCTMQPTGKRPANMSRTKVGKSSDTYTKPRPQVISSCASRIRLSFL
ncbi:hypothetical protein PM082_009602 [Marasmius tenuissimus]|nr:hypothetical protein PM082_009602 [Marasmius tenuissimus]